MKRSRLCLYKPGESGWICRRLRGGAGRAAPSHWSEGYADWPRPLEGPWGGKGGCDERGLNSQSARVCLQFFMREVKHGSAPACSCSAPRVCPHVRASGCKKMYRTKTQAKEVGEYVQVCGVKFCALVPGWGQAGPLLRHTIEFTSQRLQDGRVQGQAQPQRVSP